MFTQLFRHLPGGRVARQRSRAGLGLLLLGLALPLAAQQPRAGARRRASPAGSTGGAVALDTLTARPNLYAVGVAAGGGEILVQGGQAFTTRHRADGATETTAGFQGQARWLLLQRVPLWTEVGLVPASLTTPAQLAEFILAAVRRQGLKPRNNHPFRLLGEPLAVWWHVAAFPTTGPADAAAAELGAHGRFARESVELVGFLLPSTKHATLPRLHLHGCPGAQPFVAHVDSLRPGSGLRLLLPALPY